MGNAILLADKSVTIQKIVQLTFADDDYKIQCVADGQAALDAVPQLQPDLILADISLPLKTGYEVCRTLRTDPAFSAFSSIPVILLAGIYETMDEERAKQVEDRVKEVQASDFLSKPFDPQILVAKVKQYMKPAATMTQAAEPENIFATPAQQNDNFFAGVEDSELPGVQPPPDDGVEVLPVCPD